MVRRFLILCCLLCAFSSSPAGDTTYLQALIAQAREQGLAERPEWHALLHYQPRPFELGLRSLVDAPEFFNALRGKTDPLSELEATLTGFFPQLSKRPTASTHSAPSLPAIIG